MTLQELTAQTPVGECFEWKGEKYLVQKKNTSLHRCFGCDYKYKKECFDCSCNRYDRGRRIDEKHVIFVKQTPNEK